MKYSFNGLIKRLDTAKERISKPEDRSKEITYTESKRENQNKTPPPRIKYPRAVEQYQRVLHVCHRNLRRERTGWGRRNI